MKVLTVGIIIFIYICSYNIAAAELGDACTVGANDSCTDTGQKCAVNETCACHTDNYYNYDGSKCVRELGRDCSSFDCNDSPVVICDSADTVCKCNPETHYDNNGDKTGEEGGDCVEKHGLNEACTNPTTGAIPSYQCSTTNAVCKDDTGTSPLTYSCQCNDEYVQNGMSCLTDVDDCSSNPCKNGGACDDGDNDYTCNCVAGYTGKSCETDIDDCASSPCLNGGTCRDGVNDFTCTCRSGFYTKRCDKAALGVSCSVQGTTCQATNSECSSGNMCVCKNTHYDNDGTNNIGGTCMQKKSLGEVCPLTSAIGERVTCVDSNARCRSSGGSYKCRCADTHYDNDGTSNIGGTCVSKVGLGADCPQVDACGTSGSECSSSQKCVCQSSYYDTNGADSSGGQCSLKVVVGGVCPSPTTAVPKTATCADSVATCERVDDNYRCFCPSTHYDDNGGNCERKVVVGGICPSPTTAVPKTATCSDSIATCELDGSDYRCLCPSTHYDDNGVNVNGGKCESKKRLGEVCPRTSAIGERVTCIDSNARCRYSGGSYKCQCADTYYDNDGTSNIGGTCVSNKALGESCTGNVANECSDPNAGCLGNKCTCNQQHYQYKPSSNAKDVCEKVEQLQVTGISFSHIQTTQFTVSWTPPVGKESYISGYTIEWRPTGTSGGGDTRNVSSASPQTLTDLTPGRTYEVQVISKNTATQSGSTRSTSSKKDQAAEPSKPGTVTSTSNDLDARDNSVTIRWGTSVGEATHYRVKLIDGSTEVTNTTSTSRTAVISHPALKDGHIYTVHIEARSQAYDGNYLWSEKRISTIKTKVQVPDPPQNGNCKDPTDKSITLEWSKPADTKGDLVKYHIFVYQHFNTLKFIVSTTGTGTQKTVGNLEPGTPYTFRIYTENEMYNSTSDNYVETDCKTKAKMSEPPTNLVITNVTSRSFDISWMEPTETYSAENYGYVLQIRDDQDKCVTEIIYRCSNCDGKFQISDWAGLCNVTVRQVIPKSKEQLEGQFTYRAGLNPDISYTVTVTASNDAGRGYPANDTERTLEEAPQVPYNVTVSEIETTSLKVTWSIDEPRPGKTNFTIELMADNPAATKEFTISGFDRREYVAQRLEEYWNYSVTVKAATSVDAKTSEKTQKYTTKPAAPGEVSAFKITEAPGKNYTVMMITWKAPGILERNSIIKTYSFKHYATGKVTTTKDFTQDSLEDYVYTVMLDVIPEETYTISVYAVNDKGQKGKNITREQTAPAGVPINIEDTLGVEIIPKDLLKNKEQRRFTISLVPEFFTEQTYGIPQGTGLAACAKNCDFTGIQTLQYFDSMDNWNKASVNGFELWRITNSTFLDVLKKKQGNSRRKRSTTQLDYTVGSDDCSQVQQGEYCNGPLQPGTSYTIVAVSCTSGGCLVSKEYGPFVTLAVPDDENNLPMIIGIVVAVVVVVIGAVVGFVLLRRRNSGPGRMKPASESDDDEFTTVDPAVAKIPRKRPIMLEEIEEYVNKMHKDSNLLFSAEYEDLKTLSPKHACEAADREENRMRNRYINIIPFDHTRVKLSTNGEDDSSDYINANYLPGYSSPREYIGCQGPIPGTIDDFWRMTWEQNVSVVVMLTLCKEGQKIKCEQYWPDEVGEPKQYGDVIVEITSYSNIRTYDYRMFKITNGSTTRVVKHFHFLSWLDFQANVHHDIILDFIQHVRQHVQPPDTSGPMIIHCSAGVGRTGTYIALDHLMQFINEHDFAVEIDIFDLVLKLRENRQHMVQTEQQYVFIHDCVKEIMDRKRRQMENIYENQAFLEKLNAQDENIYQNEQSLYENVSQAKSEQNTEL